MAVNYGFNIPKDGISLLLDAKNPRSLKPENQLQYSEKFEVSPWNITAYPCTVIPNATAGPFGYPAYSISGSTTSTSLFYQNISTSIVGTGRKVSSIYAKANTSTQFTLNPYYGGDTEVNITFTLTGNGATNNPSLSYIENVGNGWYRCSAITPQRVNTGTTFSWRVWPEARGTYTTSGCYFWGAQLREISSTDKYIKTGSSALIDYGKWYDLSENKNNVTAFNYPEYSSIDNAMTFNGSGQYFGEDLVSLPSGKQTKTMICWVKPDSTSPSNTYIGALSYGPRSCPTGISTSTLLSMRTNTEDYYVSSAYWCNDFTTTSSSTTLNKDQWNMIGIIARGTSSTNNTTLFKYSSSGFGSLTGNSSSYTKTFDIGSQNLRVGCTDTTGGRSMKGNLDVAMIYRKELSNKEISQIISAFNKRYGL